MDEQRAFYDKLVVMEAALCDRPKDTDPRWSTVPPSPFPRTIFLSFTRSRILKKSWAVEILDVIGGDLHGPSIDSA